MICGRRCGQTGGHETCERYPFRLRHDRVRGHVGARQRAQGGQSRPGLPGRQRAGRCPRHGPYGARRPAEPVPADVRPARTASGGGEAQPALLWPRYRLEDRDPGDQRCDRGPGGGPFRPDRAGRRGRADRAALRLLPADHPPRRRGAETGAHRAAGLEAARSGSAHRLLRPHQAGPAQHADESGRQGLHPRRAGTDRRPVPGARRLLRRRRGLRASGVRRPAPCHDDGPARDARAHGAHRQRRQDLCAHRLEGRLHHGAAGTDDADCQNAPVSDLHDAAQPAARQRLWPGEGRQLFYRVGPRPAAQPRPLPGRAGGDRLRCHRLPRHLFHHGRFPAARL